MVFECIGEDDWRGLRGGGLGRKFGPLSICVAASYLAAFLVNSKSMNIVFTSPERGHFICDKDSLENSSIIFIFKLFYKKNVTSLTKINEIFKNHI